MLRWIPDGFELGARFLLVKRGFVGHAKLYDLFLVVGLDVTHAFEHFERGLDPHLTMPTVHVRYRERFFGAFCPE